MSTVEYIRKEIKRLCEVAPDVHVSVKTAHPRMNVSGMPARLVGAYQNIFQIEESSGGCPNRHSFQYGDVMIGQVVIEELEFLPSVQVWNPK